MKDKIIEILEKENRKMNPMDILRKIKKDGTVDDLRNLIEDINSLCREGILRSASGNNYCLNEFIVGVLDVHSGGNAHLLMKDGEDIYIRNRNLKGASDGDTVSVEIINNKTNEGRVINILKRSLGKSIGEVVDENGHFTIKVLDDNSPYKIEFEEPDINLVDGMLVHYTYVKTLNNDTVLARIDKVLGHKNALNNGTGNMSDNAQRTTLIACEYNLLLDHNEEEKEEARKLPTEITSKMIEEEKKNNREDRRNEITFTIDGKDTKDIDDAVGLTILPNGNYLLKVDIADLSYFVKPKTPLWEAAIVRGNSNYLGNKVIPMFPIELSNGICSLNPNEDRFALTCTMEIDHTGNVVNYKINKSVIRSRKKMNYDAVQDIIDGKETEDTKDYTTLEYIIKKGDNKESIAYQFNMAPYELDEYNKDCKYNVGDSVNIPVRTYIKNMYALSKILSAHKKRRGELTFESDESYIKMDNDDKVIDIIPREQRDAEKLIENFMVVANETVARFLTIHNMATYRIHERPLMKKLDEFMHLLSLMGINYPGKIDTSIASSMDIQKLIDYLKKEKAFRVLNKKLLRSMQKAIYSTTNEGHFGIASACYTHFTSPIRRVDDLLNHMSISYILDNKHLDEGFKRQWKSYLTYVCELASENERNSEKCEYAVDDMLKADYMTNHIGEEFEATIDSLFSNSFFVQTDNYIDGKVNYVLKDDKEIPIISLYEYNENLMALTKKGRAELRYGDRVLVKCTGADPNIREVDFDLVRKL